MQWIYNNIIVLQTFPISEGSFTLQRWCSLWLISTTINHNNEFFFFFSFTLDLCESLWLWTCGGCHWFRFRSQEEFKVISILIANWLWSVVLKVVPLPPQLPPRTLTLKFSSDTIYLDHIMAYLNRYHNINHNGHWSYCHWYH